VGICSALSSHLRWQTACDGVGATEGSAGEEKGVKVKEEIRPEMVIPLFAVLRLFLT
jgi:hypothetical protein